MVIIYINVNPIPADFLEVKVTNLLKNCQLHNSVKKWTFS